MPNAEKTTLIALAPAAADADPGQRVLQAVQDAVRGEYDLMGELGRDSAGVIVYLARQLRGGALVALRARPAQGPGGTGEIWLDVLRQLDATTPGPRETCLNCNQATGSWDRFCGHCGADLAGVAPDGASGEQMLQAVREAAGSRYDVIGEMNRADGGGSVYFARDRKSGKLTALRLKRDTASSSSSTQYVLGRTTVLNSVAASLGVSHGPPPPRPAPLPPAVLPPAAAPPAAPPAPAMSADAAAAALRALNDKPGALQRYALPLTIGAAVLVLIAVFAVGRPRGAPGSAADGTARSTTTSGGAAADSVRVTIGGALPPGTTVTVDGEVMMPPTFSLAAGTHRFRAAAPGYSVATASLTLTPGQPMVWTPTISHATAMRPNVAPHVVPATTQSPPPAAETPVAAAPSIRAMPRPAVSTGTPASTGTANDSMLQTLPTTTSNATCASLFSTLEWDRALPVCQKEAAGGNVASERTLGTLYDRGLGTTSNPAQAAAWYQRASDAGDRLAQYQLGVLERDGRGVKQDGKKAIDLFRKSAAQSDADAQSALGTAYERGEGVKRDYAQAIEWYRQAAEQGHPGAAYRLGVLYSQGKGAARSDSAARAWWTKAAAEGEPAARVELAKRNKS